MKKVLSLLLTTILVLSLCSFASAEAVDGTGKVVGVATQHMGNAWNRNCVQAIKDVLEPLGFTVEHQAAAE